MVPFLQQHWQQGGADVPCASDKQNFPRFIFVDLLKSIGLRANYIGPEGSPEPRTHQQNYADKPGVQICAKLETGTVYEVR